MKKPVWRRALLSIACMAFGCLLLYGGHRLIATNESESAQLSLPPAASWLHACFTCPPAPAAALVSVHAQEGKKTDDGAYVATRESDTPLALVTDANGNILRCERYMKAVYQAFALGDGFA